MSTNWNTDGYNPEIVLNRLESLKRFDSNNIVGFTNTFLLDDIAILESSLNIKNIPVQEKRRFISKALFLAGGQGTLTKKSVLKEIKRLENNYHQLKVKKFVLVTSLSLRPFADLKRRVISGSNILFRPVLPKKYNVNSIINTARHNIIGNLPNSYTYVLISVESRSIFEAFDIGINRLYLLRGMWNFVFNHTKSIRITSGRHKPVNPILVGPLHTLHKLNGNLVTDYYLFEPDYLGPLEFRIRISDWKKVKEFEKKFRYRLSKSKYKDYIENALVNYTRALDCRDLNVSFIKLWGLLETLTCSGQENYAVTIKRASFSHDNRDYHTEILKHLKNYRNKAVHMGYEADNIQTLLYQLKFYVEVLIWFHLSVYPRFSTQGEAAEYLGLPTNLLLLNRKIKLIKKAVKFHST